jgi:hypothetical protein
MMALHVNSLILVSLATQWMFMGFGFYYFYTQQKAQEKRFEELLNLLINSTASENNATAVSSTPPSVYIFDYVLGAITLLLIVIVVVNFFSNSSDPSIGAGQTQLGHLSKQLSSKTTDAKLDLLSKQLSSKTTDFTNSQDALLDLMAKHFEILMKQDTDLLDKTDTIIAKIKFLSTHIASAMLTYTSTGDFPGPPPLM